MLSIYSALLVVGVEADIDKDGLPGAQLQVMTTVECLEGVFGGTQVRDQFLQQIKAYLLHLLVLENPVYLEQPSPEH